MNFHNIKIRQKKKRNEIDTFLKEKMCFSVAKNVVIYTYLTCFSSLEDEMWKELGVCVSEKE